MIWAVLALTLPAETLVLDQAVDQALANHPEARIGLGLAQASAATARQVRGAMLPRVELAGRYNLAAHGDLAPMIRQGDTYSASLSSAVVLWDFGQRWKQWRSAVAEAESAQQSSHATEQDIVLNVRLGFFDGLETKALAQVAEETLANEQRHLEQTAEFVKSGTRPEIDLAKLRTRVAEARAVVIRTRNDHRVAKSRLNRAMGRTGRTDYEIVRAELPALPWEQQPTAALFALATANRPDLAALRATLRAKELTVEAAAGHWWPSLSVVGDAIHQAEDFRDPTWGGAVGLTLSAPLFEGLAPMAATDAARATLRVEQARLANEEQRVWQQIEEASTGVLSAGAELEAANQAVLSARDLLRLAEERYRQGVGDSLELSDAQVELANAAARAVRVEYDLAAARAQLLYALGAQQWPPR